MMAHFPPHTNSVLLMCEKLLNIFVCLGCEQCPIVLYTTVLQNNIQYSHNQVLIESKLNINIIKPFYQPPPPHVALDTTCIRFSDLVYLLFKEVMCGMNDSLSQM